MICPGATSSVTITSVGDARDGMLFLVVVGASRSFVLYVCRGSYYHYYVMLRSLRRGSDSESTPSFVLQIY